MHIAIVGCGQLSRMLALAGVRLGFSFSFIAEPDEDSCCVDGLGKVVRRTSGQPVGDLYAALGRPDVVTIEKEQVDISLLAALQDYCTVFPNPDAAAVCQHRYREKRLLGELSIDSAAYTCKRPVHEVVEALSLPIVIKSCVEGYDGKNQWVIKNQHELSMKANLLTSTQYIAEQWVDYDKEVSQISVRNQSGDVYHYPLAENLHEQGVLRQSIIPAKGLSPRMIAQAQESISKIMTALDYVGVMAMECFVVSQKLLVNELAPRVHNSGHWTQSGSSTCQFENHLRAIAGLPLGSTDIHGVAGMINLIGTPKPPLDRLSMHSTLHWYNKSVRPGRKLGHVNFIGHNHESLSHYMHQFNVQSDTL